MSRDFLTILCTAVYYIYFVQSNSGFVHVDVFWGVNKLLVFIWLALRVLVKDSHAFTR